MAALHDLPKKDDRLEKLLKKMQDMETNIQTLTNELKESKEQNKKVEKLLEERNTEISNLNYRLSDNDARYSESLRRIENQLEQRNREVSNLSSELSDMKRQYSQKEREVSDLEDRLRNSPKGVQFGGTMSVDCPKCKIPHSFPYVPGEYFLCTDGWGGALRVRVNDDGTIRSY